MTTLTNRWYRDDDDLARMVQLISAATASETEAARLHPGDITWGLFANPTIDPTALIRLFEDDQGDLRGFVWLHGGRNFMVHLDTAQPGATDTIAAMVRWAEEHLGPGEPFRIEIAPLAIVQDALTAAGYRDTGEADFQLNAQPLDGPLAEPELPEGAVVRPVDVDDPADVAARVALHREVWESSKFSVEGYPRMREKPIYRPDLDLVVVTPAGELAAYVIAWWDPDSRTSLFEPVGAALAHRRQGYAKALLRDALRRVRDLGGERAYVVSETSADREPSRRLYASLGFSVLFPFTVWERDAARAGETA